MPPLRRDDYLAVSIIYMHGIYLDTQLRTIYMYINFVEIDEGKDMIVMKLRIRKMLFSLLLFEHQYLTY